MLIIAGILGKKISKIWNLVLYSAPLVVKAWVLKHGTLHFNPPNLSTNLTLPLAVRVWNCIWIANFISPNKHMFMLHIDWVRCASAATSLSKRERFKAFFPISKLSGNSGFLIIQMKCIWTAGATKFPPYPIKQERTFQFVPPLKPFACTRCNDPMFQILPGLE